MASREQRSEWLRPTAGRLLRPTSQSGNAGSAGAWRGRRPRRGRRARPPPGRWTSGRPTHQLACTWRCWRERQARAQHGRSPQGAGPPPRPAPGLTPPGRSERPGDPAAPTPAAQAPGAGAARTPSAPAGRGDGVSLRPPRPSPPPHTHLLPGEGRDESQAAPCLQLRPLGLPVEVLVPLAAAEEQDVSWGSAGALSQDLGPRGSAWPPPHRRLCAHRSHPGPLAPGWLLGRGPHQCPAPP